MKKSRILTITGAIIILIVIFAFIFSIIYNNQIEKFLNQNIKNYDLSIVVLLSLILELIPQYISPHALILNGVIIKISLFQVTLFAIMGSILGGILGFELGKKYSKIKYKTKRWIKIKDYLNKYGKQYMAISAVSPLPYSPLIFGALKITRKEFYIYGLISRIIGLIVLGISLNYGLKFF
jgi:membrane protein YqaA with SNARE-associated domain